MAVSVLIVTPTTAFGEIIRQALTDDGGYRPVLVFDAQEAIRLASQRQFEVVIVDTDLQAPLHELELALRQTSAAMRLIVIPRQGDTQLAGLSPDLFLTKPFYMPDLLEKLDEILSPIPVSVSEKVRNELVSNGHPAVQRARASHIEDVPPWLKDVSRAAQHLTSLSLETAAQASLITRDDQLWAYAGQLPQEAATELAEAVLKDYDWNSADRAAMLKGDLARFVHLVSTNCDYMLYTTRLADKMVLAMAFDAQMPFSQMRAQTGNLARALASPPAPLSPKNHLQLAPVVEEEPDMDVVTDAWIPEPDLDERLAERLAQPFLSQDDILPPTPQNDSTQWQSISVDAGTDIGPMTLEKDGPTGSQAASTQTESGATRSQSSSHAATTTQVDAFSVANNAQEGTFQSEDLAMNTAAWHHLSYALVLLPRLPQHFITGDLSDQMSDTIQRLSLAFGWRLEQLSIRPEYLQLVILLPPDMTPESAVTNLKVYTSQWIFDDFPRLRRENPSGDFWASGYLLLGSTQLPSHQVLKSFIEQTRRIQGAPHRK